MNRSKTIECTSKIGQEVLLQGWAKNIRLMGKVAFVELRDITSELQCVGVQSMLGDMFEEIKSTTMESVIQIIGTVKSRPENQINKDLPTGTIEIEIKEYRVLSRAEALPIQVNAVGQNETDTDKRMDYRWIDLRKPEKAFVFKVWTELEQAVRNYFLENGYIEINSPKILGAPSESGAEIFEVKYFDRTAYLAQSPQFYKQMAMAAGFEKVFEFAPAFRAENSNTIRHTTEFTSWDVELSFVNSHEDVMKEEEQFLSKGFEVLKGKLGEEFKSHFGFDLEIPITPFPRMTMSEVKEALGKLGIKSEKEGDLSSEEERELGKYVKEKFNHDFVFVTDYPEEFRAFYHMRHEDNPKLTKGFDLIYKGVEITTGAQREHRYDVLKKQAEERGMNTDLIQFYLDFFRFGCPPHGGLAIGISRLLFKMMNLDSIRDTMYLFRNPKRLNP